MPSDRATTEDLAPCEKHSEVEQSNRFRAYRGYLREGMPEYIEQRMQKGMDAVFASVEEVE